MKVVGLICLIIIAFSSCSHANSGIKITASICTPGTYKAQYVVVTSRPCIKHKLYKTHSYDIEVFDTLSTQIAFDVYICEVYVTTWNTWFYFFGAKTQSKATIVRNSPAIHICYDCMSYHNAPGIGNLEPHEQNIWMTTNKVAYTYNWLTGDSGQVQNAVLTRATLVYDTVRKTIQSPLVDTSVCHYKSGHCTTSHKTIVWHPNEVTECPKMESFGKHKGVIYYNDNQVMYRFEIPDLGFSIHHFTTCTATVSTCYPDLKFCSLDSLGFVSKKCQTQNNFTILAPAVDNAVPEFTRLALLTFVQEVQDRNHEQMLEAYSYIHYVECKLSNVWNQLAKILSRQYLGEILSETTGYYITP